MPAPSGMHFQVGWRSRGAHPRPRAREHDTRKSRSNRALPVFGLLRGGQPPSSHASNRARATAPEHDTPCPRHRGITSKSAGEQEARSRERPSSTPTPAPFSLKHVCAARVLPFTRCATGAPGRRRADTDTGGRPGSRCRSVSGRPTAHHQFLMKISNFRLN